MGCYDSPSNACCYADRNDVYAILLNFQPPDIANAWSGGGYSTLECVRTIMFRTESFLGKMLTEESSNLIPQMKEASAVLYGPGPILPEAGSIL
jgi:hypothetical protein